MGAAQGSKGEAFQDYPHQRRHPHAEEEGQEKIDLISLQEENRGKGPGHIKLTLGKVN